VLLLEQNPLSVQSLEDLFRPHIALDVLGLDHEQTGRWWQAQEAAAPPRSLRVGRCEEGHRLPMYMKLVRAAELRGQRVAAAPVQERPPLLIVAFAASKAMGAEWLGLLGKLAQQRKAALEAQANPLVDGSAVFDMSNGAGAAKFWPLWRNSVNHGALGWDASGWAPGGPVDWSARNSEPDPSGEFWGDRVRDFDVLLVVDTRLRWYAGERGSDLEAALRRAAQNYVGRLFLGSSMGAFGALRYAGLADGVVALSPQVLLHEARLRPGSSTAKELQDLSDLLLESVRAAQEHGRHTRVEVHCSMDEYLHHAIHLPLADGGLVVHPLAPGRPFASVLNDAGLLLPLVASSIAGVFHGASGQAQHEGAVPVLSSNEDPRRVLRVARWAGRELLTHRSSLKEVRSWLQSSNERPPTCGDWFCCHGHANPWSEARCAGCWRRGLADAWATDGGSAVVPGGPFQRARGWGCSRCGARASEGSKFCDRCGAHRQDA